MSRSPLRPKSHLARGTHFAACPHARIVCRYDTNNRRRVSYEPRILWFSSDPMTSNKWMIALHTTQDIQYMTSNKEPTWIILRLWPLSISYCCLLGSTPQRFGRSWYLHHQGRSVITYYFNQTIRRHTAEDRNLHIQCCGNLRYQTSH